MNKYTPSSTHLVVIYCYQTDPGVPKQPILLVPQQMKGGCWINPACTNSSTEELLPENQSLRFSTTNSETAYFKWLADLCKKYPVQKWSLSKILH